MNSLLMSTDAVLCWLVAEYMDIYIWLCTITMVKLATDSYSGTVTTVDVSQAGTRLACGLSLLGSTPVATLVVHLLKDSASQVQFPVRTGVYLWLFIILIYLCMVKKNNLYTLKFIYIRQIYNRWKMLV